MKTDSLFPKNLPSLSEMIAAFVGMIPLSLIFCLILTAGSPVFGAGPEAGDGQDPYRLGDVIVTADGFGPGGSIIGTGTTVIEVSDIAAPARRETVLDILEKAAGVDVMRGDMALSDDRDVVKLRGFGGRRILVRLDGRPVRNAGGFGDTLVDWTSLTLAGVDSIEVMRGGHSAVYGETIGGTINIRRKKASDRPGQISICGDYSSQDTRLFTAGLSGTSGETGYFLAGALRSSQGYLNNGDYEIRDFSGRITQGLSTGGMLSLSYGASGQDKHLFTVNDPSWPGYDSSYPHVPVEAFGPVYAANFAGGQDYYDRNSQYVDLVWQQPWTGGDLELHLYGTYETREASVYRFSGTGFYDYVWDVSYRDLGWIIRNRSTLGENHRVTIGADGRNSYGSYRMTSPFRSSGTDMGKWIEHLAGYVEDSWRITDKLNLTLGLRFDQVRLNLNVSDFTDTLREWSPKSGLTYEITPGTSVYGNFSKAFRVPTAMEYGWIGFPTGEALDNETAVQYDVGIVQNLPGDTTLRLGAFHYNIDNYIVFNEALSPQAAFLSGRPLSESVFNADYLKLTGIELELDFKIGRELTGYFNYTFQEPELGSIPVPKDEPRIDIYQLPRHKANIGLQWYFFERTALLCSARWVDDRKTSLNEKIGGYVTADLALRHEFLEKKASLTGYVANAFNTDYEEKYRVPAPDRIFGIRLCLSF